MSGFESHCESIGIQLLGDDVKLIKAQLLKIPQQLHKQILTTYADKFLKGMATTGIVYKQQNCGRKAANTYMNELVENGYRNSKVV